MIEQLITSELPEGWANAYRAELQSTLKEIRRASAREPDALTSIADRYDRTARKFISIMANVPGLSAIPRLRWEVPSHCKVFDELASILDEFEGLAKSQHPWEVTAAAKRVTRFLSDLLFWADGPGSVEPASVPAQPAAPAAAELDSEQENELGQLGHPKIVLPTDPDVADVWNTFQAVTVGTANVSEICREVAGKSGANAESLRKKFYRWKSQNIG